MRRLLFSVILVQMLSYTERTENKSKGPWGMKNFNFTYRRMGESVSRHRFVNAPSEESAVNQFNALMDRENYITEIISVEETE